MSMSRVIIAGIAAAGFSVAVSAAPVVQPAPDVKSDGTFTLIRHHRHHHHHHHHHHHLGNQGPFCLFSVAPWCWQHEPPK